MHTELEREESDGLANPQFMVISPEPFILKIWVLKI